MTKGSIIPQVVRIALTHADIATLPASGLLPPTTTDTRYNAFKAKYGANQWCSEIKNMPAGTLKQRVIDAIEQRMDVAALAHAKLAEDIVTDAAKAIVSGMPELRKLLFERIKDDPRLQQPHLLYLNAPKKNDEETNEL